MSLAHDAASDLLRQEYDLDGSVDRHKYCQNCGVIVENADEIKEKRDVVWECLTCGNELKLKERQQ